MPNTNLKNQEGFTLLSTVLMTGIASFITLGTYQVIDQQTTTMKIVRAQQRIDLLEKRVRNMGQSTGGMKVSAEKNPESALGRCIVGKTCEAFGIWETLPLYDAMAQPVSGLFNLSGDACRSQCPLEVVTQIQIICPGGAMNCVSPSEIKTSYRIRKASEENFNGRFFNEVSGNVSLSTFSCPKDQYIRGLSKDGEFVCGSSFYASTQSNCPDGTAAVGTDSKGYLKCQAVTDYCSTSLDVATVVDVSSSMYESLPTVQADLAKFMTLMRVNQDQGSLISFSRQSKLLQPLVRDFTVVRGALGTLDSSKGSYVGRGITVGAESILEKNSNQKILLLITDGRASAKDDPISAANLAKAQGIRIITIGYSSKVDVALMQAMASSPKDFYNVNTMGSLEAALAEVGRLVCR